MAKLARESRLRERRMEKKARKDARKLAASEPPVADVHDIDEAHADEEHVDEAPAEVTQPVVR